jgi:hypothetical protein
MMGARQGRVRAASSSRQPTEDPLNLDLVSALRKLAGRASVVRMVRDGHGGSQCTILMTGRGVAGTVASGDFDRARAAGFLEEISGDDGAWRLSKKGREAVRRLVSDGTINAAITPPTPTQPGFNADESPLAWLRRRKGKSGSGLISEQEFQAGERLRADFAFAQLTPRVTASWNAALGASACGRRGVPGAGVEMADGVLAAAERVNRALHAVGPELSGILVDVCCHLKGLEDLERSIGWPQRSGKVVLQIALRRLANHYGLPREPSAADGAASRPRHWGAPDYRPVIDAGDAAMPPDQPPEAAD